MSQDYTERGTEIPDLTINGQHCPPNAAVTENIPPDEADFSKPADAEPYSIQQPPPAPPAPPLTEAENSADGTEFETGPSDVQDRAKSKTSSDPEPISESAPDSKQYADPQSEAVADEAENEPDSENKAGTESVVVSSETADLSETATAEPEDESPKRRKRRPSFLLKASILTFCACLLIVSLTVVIVSVSNLANRRPRVSSSNIPNIDGGITDFEDYFDRFYNSSASGTCSIKSVTPPKNITLTLSPAAGNGEMELSEVYEKCAPAIVGIMAGSNGADTSWGTGIIFSGDGYIVTNFHIIDSTDSARVLLADDREYSAFLVGYDSDSDIAVLKINETGLPCAEFGDSTGLKVGEDVVAIGNPLGEEFRGTMTNGIISAIDRNVDYEGHSMALIQTNAAINEGNSGGPLINMSGQVIGITNMKMISYYSNIEGIGFAIPSRSIKAIVDELLEYGYVSGHPVIGITIVTVSEELEEQFNVPPGLYIQGVEENSSAYDQGIRPGDILTAVNGIPVTTNEEVSAIKNELHAGDQLTLTLYRYKSGETFDTVIILQEKGEVFR